MNFLKFFEKICHYLFSDLVLNKSSYYWLCTCTNPIYEKILVLELTKMLSASEAVGFLYQLINSNCQSEWFFAYGDRLKEDKRWLENFLFDEVKEDLEESGCGILKSTISQVSDESTWFLTSIYRFKKRKRWFESF